MGREPAPFRGSGSQGSDPPAGGYVGKASRAPLVLRGSRSLRPTATGQTFRAERRREAETHSPTVSGLRARRSAGPSHLNRLLRSRRKPMPERNQPMSRPKPRRAIPAIDGHDPAESALRAELEDRLDQLRAVIEARRAKGWTVVRCPAPSADQTY